MSPPDVLALDFDGVLCDGMREYFEASRRSWRRVWPDEPPPGPETFAAFRALRPVILSGWEMPLLLRAIAGGRSESAVLGHWEVVRDELVGDSGRPRGSELVEALKRTVDEVRREWIAADRDDWLAHNAPYCGLDELARVVAEPAQAVVVTTKEGEFAREILDHWKISMAGIQGKEAGTHKCENLRALIAEFTAARGRRPALWFVEDRLETLQHVTTHSDLADVGLFLAAWGYNTAPTREAARASARVRLLELDHFRRGPARWR
ncbi:MAG TPA: HAD family hydrolase [Candidatus Methylomirabilis sp.]|nr:HAD family hydrolase [Candidatus Methylomirabilis sp.]